MPYTSDEKIGRILHISLKPNTPLVAVQTLNLKD